MKRKKKTYRRRRKIIVTLSVVAAVMIALIITNVFIPVIYFTAYVHFKKDENPLGQLRVRYLDVGFGDCTLVELPDGKTMLIDGGAGTYSNVYKLLDVLNKSNIDKIDYLFCTSVKSEHCGALAEVARYKKIGTAYVPQVTNLYITDEFAAFYSELSKIGADIQIAQFGVGAYNSEYGYSFMVMSPMSAELPECEYHSMNAAPTEFNINNASVVLWLQYDGHGFMFLGDATDSVQLGVAETIRLEKGVYKVDGVSVQMSPCAVIKTANHCAADYAEPRLYDILSVGAAVISVGENAKSCPSLTDIANLQLYVGNNLFRTDMHGTVTVTVYAADYKISKEK